MFVKIIIIIVMKKIISVRNDCNNFLENNGVKK
jgi:hypothetical protein